MSFRFTCIRQFSGKWMKKQHGRRKYKPETVQPSLMSNERLIHNKNNTGQPTWQIFYANWRTSTAAKLICEKSHWRWNEKPIRGKLYVFCSHEHPIVATATTEHGANNFPCFFTGNAHVLYNSNSLQWSSWSWIEWKNHSNNNNNNRVKKGNAKTIVTKLNICIFELSCIFFVVRIVRVCMCFVYNNEHNNWQKCSVNEHCRGC